MHVGGVTDVGGRMKQPYRSLRGIEMSIRTWLKKWGGIDVLSRLISQSVASPRSPNIYHDSNQSIGVIGLRSRPLIGLDIEVGLYRTRGRIGLDLASMSNNGITVGSYLII